MINIFVFPWCLCVWKHSRVWMEDQCMYICLLQDDRLMATSCSFRHGRNAQQEDVPTVKSPFKWMIWTQGIGRKCMILIYCSYHASWAASSAWG